MPWAECSTLCHASISLIIANGDDKNNAIQGRGGEVKAVTCDLWHSERDKGRKCRLEEWVLFLALAKLLDVSLVMLLCLDFS